MAGRRLARSGAIALAAIGLGVFAWRAAFPSDERQIRRTLSDLADRINEQPQGLAAVAQAAEIGSVVADDVVVELGEGSPIRGRDAVMAIVARVQPRTSRYEVTIRDMNVRLESDTAASVDLSVTTSGENGMDAREFQVGMVKRGGTWLIARVKPVRVLER